MVKHKINHLQGGTGIRVARQEDTVDRRTDLGDLQVNCRQENPTSGRRRTDRGDLGDLQVVDHLGLQDRGDTPADRRQEGGDTPADRRQEDLTDLRAGLPDHQTDRHPARHWTLLDHHR